MTTALSAYVVGCATLTFPEGFPEQNRDDVNNSIIFSELASNRRYNRLTQRSDWYASFLTVLGQIGWMNEGSIRFDSIPNGGSTSVDDLVITTLQQSLSDSELNSVRDTIRALQSGNDAQAKLFNGQATDGGSGKQANFGIGPCRMDDDNASCMFNAFDFTFSGSTSSSGALFQELSQGDTSFGGQVKMTLNANVYNMIRDSIVEKLQGADAGNLVKEITL
ncbi:hypothetical protein JAAARDRAFT_68389 [Jaapia argillacea MUCL 33604]|uniref:Uncharacterized protein n=1 Tax=Jaapia argillacea MUCL 33604 TaxID=933084 RepID=A0A067PYC3_9AGAM|nr:hypothetical protein JAAARDRAFT_68389 [Jaapia argillacea MUCL 33604]